MSRKSPEQFAREVKQAEAKLPEARALLKGVLGVIEVQVGIKETGGLATEEVAFHVYVERKLPLEDVAPQHRIPPRIAGVATDVIGRELFVREAVLMGGMRVTQSSGGGPGGTLGAIALATAANAHLPPDTPVLLTNHHVAETVGGLVGIGSLCDSWCCECCDVGRVVDSQLTGTVDAAIARLNTGVRFSHEIIGIGPIREFGTATQGMPILKQGQTTGLTRGTVTAINHTSIRDDTTLTGQIRVAPAPPSTDMSEGGDSGSVYVDADTNRVVGLHHAGAGTLATGNHIGPVMSLLNITFPLVGTAAAIPLQGAPDERPGPTILEAMAALRRDLERTEIGRQWAGLMRTHAEEVRGLVNHDRETKMAWHRSQGPAFVAHYARCAREADYRVPREVGGMRIENVILSMAAVLQRRGSLELSQAITEHYLTALQFARDADSADTLIERARRLALAEDGPREEEARHG